MVISDKQPLVKCSIPILRHMPPHAILYSASNGRSVLIDVREPAEFDDHHLVGAINLPASQFDETQYTPFRDQHIYLVCQSGNRAEKIAHQLRTDGFSVYVLEEHMAHLQDKGIQPAPKGWTIDRQFRFTLGMLLALFLLGYHGVSHYFLIIPVILCMGLTITALLDRCYLRLLIAKMPWNRGKSE